MKERVITLENSKCFMIEVYIVKVLVIIFAPMRQGNKFINLSNCQEKLA